MTVITALRSDGCIFMCADSQVTEVKADVELKIRQQKLDFPNSKPIAWGFVGADEIGSSMSQWMRNLDWRSLHDLQTFREAFATEVSTRNGDRRRRMKLAGMEVGPEDTSDFVIVGFWNDEPFIFRIENDGSLEVDEHDSLTTIGSGWVHAKVSFETSRFYRMSGVKIPDDRLIKVTTEIAASMAPLCGLPVRLLRISPEKVEDLKLR